MLKYDNTIIGIELQCFGVLMNINSFKSLVFKLAFKELRV